MVVSMRDTTGKGIDAIVRGAPLVLLALCAGIVPVLLSPATTTYAEAKLAAALTCIGVLWVLLSAASIRSSELAVRVPLPAWGAAGFLAAILISGLAATVWGIWWEGLIEFVALSSMILLAASIPRSRSDVRAVVWGLAAAGVVVAIYALLQAFGAVATGQTVHTISVMGNPNLVGGFLVIIIPTTLTLVWFAKTILRRIAALALVAVQLSALAPLNHTGGVLALSIGLLFVAVVALASGGARAIFRRDGWSIIAVLLIVVGVAAAGFFGPAQSFLVRDRGQQTTPATGVTALWDANSGAERETFWRTALMMVAERPLTGVGLGHFQIEYLDTLAALVTDDPSITAPPRPTTHAHNDYLQLAAETGAPGLVAIVAVLVLLAVYGIRRTRSAGNEDQRMEVVFLLGGVVAYLILAAVSFPMYSISSTWPAVILLGLAGSPAYGQRGVRTVCVRGGLRWAFLASSAALAIVVSGVAWRGFNGDVLLNRGTRQLQGGFPTVSEATLTRSIDVDPNPRHAYYYRSIARILEAEQAGNAGDAARSTEWYEGAAEDLRECETRFPWPEVYLTEANLGFIIGDRAMTERAIAVLVAIRQPTELYVQALYLQALLAKRDGLTAEAMSTLLEIAAIDPDYHRADIALGEILENNGDLDAARVQYRKALSGAEAKLAAAEQQLASADTLPASTVSGLQQTAAEARQEIRLAVQALSRLPEATP